MATMKIIQDKKEGGHEDNRPIYKKPESLNEKVRSKSGSKLYPLGYIVRSERCS